MFDVLDIKCKLGCTTGDSSTDRENTWDGQIVIDETGYFEGLVVPSYSDVYKEKLVFGVYKDNSISLYKFEPGKDSIRTRYDGWVLGDLYSGNFCVSIDEEPLVKGEFSIEVSRSVKKELVEGTISDIMFRTDNWRGVFFSEEANSLYEKLAVDIIREKDNGVSFVKK